MSKGILISFEGGDGCGKSTQITRVKEYLESLGYTVLVKREPGGVRLGEEIRKMLLDPVNKGMELITELLLFNSSRHEHVMKAVKPALKEYDFVILDRYYHSTLAYQGYGRGIDLETVKQVIAIAVGLVRPRLTIILDIDPSEGLLRAAKSSGLDRIEQEGLEFHQRVRKGYKALAEEDPEHVKFIDGSGSEEQVFESVKGYVDTLL